ncbi:DsbA family protein [Exercitatus varius]|uniref:DsbA family protein n=1 Tax=Exercitatus varius TaxID=67857 RepID=UPI00294B29A6|nr:DsbA family protein [Exercitatus varius]MDG2941346.1 DsbA family protein [Exercitatus varius]
MLNDKTHSVLIYHFTDPMMGLTYESEPFLRQLETHFGKRVRLQFVMGGLVRDVADFMIADDFKDGKEHAFIRYNARLAKIYESEQSISGMPIKMDRLNLFAENRRSSIPLNLAFKAVERIYPDKAEHFLYRLRYATIVEQRITTDESELTQIALDVGIDKAKFMQAYQSDATHNALQHDFALRAKLGIRALPAYLFCYGDKQRLQIGVLNFADFVQIIDHLSDGKISPQSPILDEDTLQNFIQKRPLVALTEIRHAFCLADNQTVTNWLDKIPNAWQWVGQDLIKSVA